MFVLLPLVFVCVFVSSAIRGFDITTSIIIISNNDKFINTIITDITAYAENKWEKEIDIIMVGHYHQQKIITKNEKSLVFLGDWLSKFSVTTIIDEKIWQGNWKQFIKLS